MGNQASSPSLPLAHPAVDPAFLTALRDMPDLDTHIATMRVCVPHLTSPQCMAEGDKLLTALRALCAAVASAKAQLQEAVVVARKTVRELQLVYMDYLELVRTLKDAPGVLPEVISACADGAAQMQAALAACSTQVASLSATLHAHMHTQTGLSGGSLCIAPFNSAAPGECYDSPLSLPADEVVAMVAQLRQDVAEHAEAVLWLGRATSAAAKQREMIAGQAARLAAVTRLDTCPAATVHQVAATIRQLAVCQATAAELEVQLQAAHVTAAKVVEVSTGSGVLASGVLASAGDTKMAGAEQVATAAHGVAVATVEAVPAVEASVTAEDAVARVIASASADAAQRAATVVERIVVEVVRMSARDVKTEAEGHDDSASLDAPVRNPSYLRGFLLAFLRGVAGTDAQRRYDALLASVKAPLPPAPTGPVTRVKAFVPASAAPPVEFALAFEPLRRRLMLRRILTADPLLRDTLHSYLAALQARSRGIAALTAGFTIGAPVATLRERNGLQGGSGLHGGVIFVTIGADGSMNPVLYRRHKGQLIPAKTGKDRKTSLGRTSPGKTKGRRSKAKAKSPRRR